MTQKSHATGDASQSRAPRIAGACDCHVHVFMPERYSYAADRAYTPGTRTIADLAAFLSGHGLDRVVLVQPSIYGYDNRLLLDAIAELGMARARGVAVVDTGDLNDRALSELDAGGVRGLRVNTATSGTADIDAFRHQLQATASIASEMGWCVQIYAPLDTIVSARRDIEALRVPVILDHFSGARMSGGNALDGIGVVADVMRNGPAFAKLSALYRVTAGPAGDWTDVEPVARLLFDANPERLIWGSDWPHTGPLSGRKSRAPTEVEPFQVIDNRRTLDLLSSWAGDERVFERMLVDNPQALFGFDPNTNPSGASSA